MPDYGKGETHCGPGADQEESQWHRKFRPLTKPVGIDWPTQQSGPCDEHGKE
ncbi:MAG: hypothetical protein MK128_11255 [Dehalococcoidia bacterium]|nr:hypothetical protein [Dehalococcoidia bacterium]MEE2926228.1 hypothetical protein [Chloroflexota bacterium]